MSTKPTDEQIVEALNGSLGQVSRAAEKLDCPIDWIHRRARASRRVRGTLRLFRGKLLDLAEGAIWKGLLERESWAVKLTFELWGRSRDFTDGGEAWHAPGHAGDEIHPELVRQLAEELLNHAHFTETVRAGGAGADAGDVCPPRERRALEDGGASGGHRPCHCRHDSGSNGADPGH
jgi:hypothetical protein